MVLTLIRGKRIPYRRHEIIIIIKRINKDPTTPSKAIKTK